MLRRSIYNHIRGSACLVTNLSKANRNSVRINLIEKRRMSSELEKAQVAKPTDDTIFGKIIRKEIPAEFLYEDDLCIAINDIAPVAPVHFLVIPKKPIVQLSKSDETDEQILGRLLSVARKVAVQKGISDGGYRTVINDGKHGCQSVYHLHVHVLGGKQLGIGLRRDRN